METYSFKENLEHKKPNFEKRLEEQRKRDLPKLLERAKLFVRTEPFNEGLDYSDLANNYRGLDTLYKFKCSKHGEFEEVGDRFLTEKRRRKILCPKCNNENKERNKLLIRENREKRRIERRMKIQELKKSMPAIFKETIKSQEDFRRRGELLYGDQYIYDKVIYKDIKTPVIIICKDHGEYYAVPHTFFKGFSSCPDCGASKRENRTKVQLKDFALRLYKTYGTKYKFVLKSYVDMSTPCIFVCKEHGAIVKTPSRFLKYGCDKCSYKDMSMTYEDFVAKANEIHDGKFRYLKRTFVNAQIPMTIICPYHGHFSQKPTEHIRQRFLKDEDGNTLIRKGAGCLLCRESKQERMISDTLTKLGVKFSREVRCGETLLRIDFLLRTTTRIAIEYDGIHHFKQIWHDVDIEKMQANDRQKEKYIREKGWILYRIPYTVPDQYLEDYVNQLCYEANLKPTDFISQNFWDSYKKQREIYFEKKTSDRNNELSNSDVSFDIKPIIDVSNVTNEMS